MDRSAFLRVMGRCGLAAGALLVAPASHAQTFPSGPVTLICPYAPGTGIDIVARIVAQKLGETWPQPVLVKNMPGGSGNIGAAAAASSKADGSTFVIIANSHLINQHVGKNVVDANTALTAIAPAGKVPYLLTVSSSLPVRTVQELVALARSTPGQLNYSGVHGSVPHLLGVALATSGNVDIRFVSYKSTTDAIADAASGRVPIWFTTVASAMPLIQSGKVRALAVTGDKRVRMLPDVPTMTEAGRQGMDLGAAFYFMAPAGTPAPVVEKMNRDIVAALMSRDVSEKLAEQGAQASASSPQELTRLLSDESRKWGELVKASGIKAD
ncbi:MAG TPA: tripartite tricarboxylate transporter substrate-binding protein [Ramlibacter sp.]|nr:tripartite tricarboxylate transporter substrate-binding protein [Ramlibacter sp.]